LICSFVCPLPECMLLKLWYLHNNFSLCIATENKNFKCITESFSDSFNYRGYDRSPCWSPWSPGVAAGLQYSCLSPVVSLGLQESLLVSSGLAWSPGSLLVSISGGPCWSPLVSGCPCWSAVSHLVSRCYCWSPLIYRGLCWSPSVSNGLC